MANKRKRTAYLATRNRGRGEKDNTEYWRDRAIEREALWNKKSRSTVEKELAEQYRKAALAIQDDIAVLYGRFATDNGLTLKEAKALLTGREFKEWRMSLEEYTALSAHDNAILRELNTLAMRPRISRLEKLHGDILQELYKLGKSTCKSLDTFLGDAYKDNYYKGLQEIGKTVGLQNAISAVSTKTLEGVLRTPWSGKNYSERIWTNHKRLADTLKDTISAGLHRGLSVPKLSQMVQERMGVGQHEATRLVRTELTYVHNQANLDSLKEGGFKYYKFVATLDKRTSSMCRDRDGDIIPIEDAAAGKSLPPLHPHCRSTIIGSLGEGKGGKSGSRIARDSKGRNIYIPRQMTYKDYKAVYIDQSKPLSMWAKEAGFVEDLAKYTPKVSSQGTGDGAIIEPKEPRDGYAGQIANARAQMADLNQQQAKDWTVERDRAMAELHKKIEGLKVEAAQKGEILTSGLENYLPKEDLTAIVAKVKDAPENIRVAWNRFEEKMAIAELKNAKGAWYSPGNRSITFNLANDRRGKPPYKTIFHELGHLIDHNSGRCAYSPSAFRNGGELRESLQREGKAYLHELKSKMQAEVVKKGGKKSMVKMENVYYALRVELREIPMEARREVSDMWDGITRKRANGNFGHDASYWKDETHLPIEAFAEMFCATVCNPESLANIKRYFPDSYRIFEDIIADIAERGYL